MTGQWIVWAYETALLWFRDRATFWRRVALGATARRVYHERMAAWDATRPTPLDPETALLDAHHVQLNEAADAFQAANLAIVPMESVALWQRMEVAAADAPSPESPPTSPPALPDTDLARELWAVHEAIANPPLLAPPGRPRKGDPGTVH